MKKYLMMMILIGSLCSVPFEGRCDDDPPPPPTEDPDTPTQNAPLDGGLSFLLAAGVGYGAKKAHNYRKRKAVEKS
jgi:hypothetical protein